MTPEEWKKIVEYVVIFVFVLFPIYCAIHVTVIVYWTGDPNKFSDIYDYSNSKFKTGWWKFVNIVRWYGYVVIGVLCFILFVQMRKESRQHVDLLPVYLLNR